MENIRYWMPVRSLWLILMRGNGGIAAIACLTLHAADYQLKILLHAEVFFTIGRSRQNLLWWILKIHLIDCWQISICYFHHLKTPFGQFQFPLEAFEFDSVFLPPLNFSVLFAMIRGFLREQSFIDSREQSIAEEKNKTNPKSFSNRWSCLIFKCYLDDPACTKDIRWNMTSEEKIWTFHIT